MQVRHLSAALGIFLSSLINAVGYGMYPQAETLVSESLSQNIMLTNGIEIYMKGNPVPEHYVSLRIVKRTPLYDHIVCSFDSPFDSLEELDQFLLYCKSKIFQVELVDTLSSYSVANDDLLEYVGASHQERIAIIAIGNFLPDQIYPLLEKHFGSLPHLKGIQQDENSRESVQQRGIYIEIDPRADQATLQIAYSATPADAIPFADMKETWKYLLLQDLLEQRIERLTKRFEKSQEVFQPRFLFPQPLYASIDQERAEAFFSFVLGQIEAVKLDGFSEEEFTNIKEKMMKRLQFLSTENCLSHSMLLASYWVDRLAIGDSCLSFESFLNISQELIESMQLSDIEPCMDSFLADDNRMIRIVFPEKTHPLATLEAVQRMIEKVSQMVHLHRNHALSKEASINNLKSEILAEFEERSWDGMCESQTKDLPILLTGNQTEALETSFLNPMDAIDAFYQLPLPEKDQRLIHSIIKTMADKNVFQLLFEKKELEKKGKKVNHVHPMRFIAYILGDPKLKSCLKQVKGSSFKWDHFMDGFSRRMKEESSKDNVEPYAPGFAHHLHANLDQVNHHVHKRDWEGLVKSLL